MSDERFKGAEGLIDFSINSVIKAAPEGGDEDDIIIEGMANTTTVDRAGDLIPRSTWEKESQLSNYRKNPIVLAYHNHSMPIGIVESLEVKDEGLFVRVRISNTIPAVFQQIKKNILKAFSIGFRLLDWEYKPDVDVFLMTEIEMTELSVVSVPCNQDSMFDLAKSFGVQNREELKAKLIKEPTPKKQNTQIAPVEPEIVKLARQLGCLRKSVK